MFLKALISLWLIAFNAVSWCGWAFVLASVVLVPVLQGASWPGSETAAQAVAGIVNAGLSWLGERAITLAPTLVPATALPLTPLVVLQAVQTLAVLELIHAIIGFVKASPFATAMQISSRLFIVWAILGLNPEAGQNPAYITCVCAWSITEIIRYAFYGFSLIGVQVKSLAWARYTFFYVLYPVGFFSEIALIFKSLNVVSHSVPSVSPETVKMALNVVLGLWVFGFYVLYSHMIRQRSKALGKAISRKSKPE